MELTRKVKVDTNEICVGDQLSICLKGFGNFTASAHKITDEGAIFLFDRIIAIYPIYKRNANVGGFEKSDMKKWLYEVVVQAFPENIRRQITDISLPTYGQIFGHEDFSDNYLEQDDDMQFELMKRCEDRICFFKNKPSWYWLRNSIKGNSSAAYFAYVNGDGNPYYGNASYSRGVRPEFILKKEI